MRKEENGKTLHRTCREAFCDSQKPAKRKALSSGLWGPNKRNIIEILALLQGCCGLETTALKNHFSERKVNV